MSDNDRDAVARASKIPIDSLEVLRNAACDVFLNAKRKIQILSYDLDPRILNHSNISSIISKFIRLNRISCLQILIFDEKLMQGRDHCLVSLAQRFSSNIEIRVIPKDFHENLFCFYIVDQKAMLFRSLYERFEATLYKEPNFDIMQRQKYFDDIWQQSAPASFLRALHL